MAFSLGNFVGGLAGAAASVYSTNQQNKNIDKQLAAQQRENALNREYNLNLAKMQNQWSVEQWNRENAYNSPQAQIARMKAAGLNPDMMYGGGVSGNLSASSPQMTSGAPSSPIDWSNLANKKTIGTAVAEALQLEQMRANIRKTDAEAGVTESDAKYRDKFNELGIEVQKSAVEKVGAEIENLSTQARMFSNDADLKAFEHDMQKKFGEQFVKEKLRELASQASISETEAEYQVKALTNRLLGLDAETKTLEWTAKYNSSAWRVVIEIIKVLLPQTSFSHKF